MINLKTSGLSLVTVLLIITLVLFFRFQETPTNVLSWDTFGYYLYLPAKFIYDDPALLQQDWLNLIIDKYETTATFYQGYKMESGKWVIKYTMGLSVLWAPFFFLAHYLAPTLGFEADGFSLPYQVSIILGTIFYFLIGLIYLVKVLRRFFSDKTTSIILLILALGTNYFQLSFSGTLLSHAILVGFYAALIWYTIRWHEKPHWKYAAAIGGLCGFIVLIRASELTSILIPLLWNIHNKASFRKKVNLIRENLSHLMILIFFCIVAGAPQLLYWKAMAGTWIHYSYNNPGEGFEFLSPYTWQYLFSFRKGWLIYTPLVSLGILGFVLLYRKKREIFWAFITYLTLELWICSSWSTWWYAGGSYSARAILPTIAILAIPLGMLLEYINQRSLIKRIIFSSIVILLVVLNLFQTWQYDVGIIDQQRMTSAYYFRIFGKTNINEEDKKLLLVKRAVETYEHFTDPENYNQKSLVNFTFEEESIQDTAYPAIHQSLLMNKERQFSPGVDISFKDLTNHYYAWIKAEVDVFIPEEYQGEMPLLTLHFTHKGKAYKYRTIGINENDLVKGKWQKVSLDYMTPEVRNEKDNLKVYVWHRSQDKIFVDNLKVDVYEPKDE